MSDTPPRGERGGERGVYGLFSRKRGTQKWQQIRGLSNDGLCLVALPWICPTSGVLKIKRTASNERISDTPRTGAQELCAPAPAEIKLLDLDLGPGRFDLFLDLFGFGFGDAFLQRLRCAFDQRLSFG